MMRTNSEKGSPPLFEPAREAVTSYGEGQPATVLSVDAGDGARHAPLLP